MAQASKNLGLTGTLTSSGSAYIAQGITQASDYFMEGDEVYLDGINEIVWVNQIVGNQIFLIDKEGNAITGVFGNNPDSPFEIVRSGHRNLQSAGIMNVTLMKNPLLTNTGSLVTDLSGSFLSSNNWSDWLVINAGAVDYSDEWTVGCECGVDPGLETKNPYVFNEKGVWRTKSSRTYLTGRNAHNEVTPRREGFFTQFSPMYQLLPQNVWTKNFTDWTYVAEVTQYSPYGFELENKDALDRYSAAQYGYNNTFPIAVGANTKYNEIGFDGFEDRDFDGCPYSTHFAIEEGGYISSTQAHTGKHSIRVLGNSRATISKKLDCTPHQDDPISGDPVE